ncbi:MAG: lectin-like domain-containing protein [Bacteroidia bacterium]
MLQVYRTIFVVYLAFISLAEIKAQSYFANGDAVRIGQGSCYQITPSAGFKLGSVWYADQLDISKDFDLEFYLNFGSRDQDGADGMYFVLQTAGNKALGDPGGGMGFEGFSPSLGIEFDTWNNTDLNDIAEDHIAITKNGDPRHTGSNSVVAPVTAIPGGGNIEDGEDHLVRIVWEQNTKMISVYFDCELRISTRINMQFDIFQTENLVYWGFTGATGGSVNTHVACLRDDILVPDTSYLCRGDTITLNAKESQNSTYSWKPSTGLDDPTIRTPRCFSTVHMDYEVSYLDLCGNLLVDTVHVGIDEPFTIEDFPDSLLCDGLQYYFDLKTAYDSVLWGDGNTSKRVVWVDEGFYTIRAWRGVCYDDDSFYIYTDISPNITFSGDSLFCEGDSTFIEIQIEPNDAAHQWFDGSTVTRRSFKSSTSEYVSVSNDCGSGNFPFEVEEIRLDDLELGADTILCEGDSLILNAGVSTDHKIEWNTGESSMTLLVTEPGDYSVEISKNDLCYDDESISVVGVELPILGEIDDVLLCINEVIYLSTNVSNGTLIWNNAVTADSFVLKNYNGEINVKASNICGDDSSTLQVELKECFCNIIYPNAFTPNDDVLNESFKATVDCPKLSSYEHKIYNRWGEMIFETSDISNSWDGTFSGQKVPMGVYYWISEWSGIENGLETRKIDKGIIHVLY